MFSHPEILFDLARQHQNELIDQARSATLVRAARRGRAAGRRARRAAGGTRSHADGSHPDWDCLDQNRPAPPTARVTAPAAAAGAGPTAGSPASLPGGAAVTSAIGALERSVPAGSLVLCGAVEAEPAR